MPDPPPPTSSYVHHSCTQTEYTVFTILQCLLNGQKVMKSNKKLLLLLPPPPLLHLAHIFLILNDVVITCYIDRT